MLSHHLGQYWIIVNWKLKIQEHTSVKYELQSGYFSCICKCYLCIFIAAIVLRHQCIKLGSSLVIWNGYMVLPYMAYMTWQCKEIQHQYAWYSLSYTPWINEVESGVHWFHVVRPSVCLSACPSVCGQNHAHSVTSTIVAGSISYLHILSSSFRRCGARNKFCKILKFEILSIFLNM